MDGIPKGTDEESAYAKQGQPFCLRAAQELMV
jgi:hypothetical protein